MTGNIDSGRVCPVDYLYRPEDLSRQTTTDADTLYVVGGMYGNPFALRAVKNIVSAEQDTAANVKLIFNGDFNWFNKSSEDFENINNQVLQNDALRGNVETEISRPGFGGGCGCGYPPSVSNEVVTWSNEIIDQLHQTATDHPLIQQALQQLPMYRRYRIGGTTVNVVHGDCRSLAGWAFSRQNLLAETDSVTNDAQASDAQIIACTHTCEPFATIVGSPDNPLAIINNGSAGMPNLNNGNYGIITRISTIPAPMTCLYGTQVNSVHLDAIAVNYPQEALLDWFTTLWPAGTAAHRSYYKRLTTGTNQGLSQSLGRGFSIACELTAARRA